MTEKEIDDMVDAIQEEMLEYHRAFVMAGRSDIASAVANCLDIVLKKIEEREKDDTILAN